MVNRYLFRGLLALTIISGAVTPAAVVAQPVDQELKALVDRYWAAWGTGDPANAAPLYDKAPNREFYDLEPVKWTGWADYAKGVVPHILAKFSAIKFSVNRDFTSGRDGSLAWTAVTIGASGVLRATGPITVTIRHTAVWQRRGNEWLIIHEHVSVPSTLPAAPEK